MLPFQCTTPSPLPSARCVVCEPPLSLDRCLATCLCRANLGLPLNAPLTSTFPPHLVVVVHHVEVTSAIRLKLDLRFFSAEGEGAFILKAWVRAGRGTSGVSYCEMLLDTASRFWLSQAFSTATCRSKLTGFCPFQLHGCCVAAVGFGTEVKHPWSGYYFASLPYNVLATNFFDNPPPLNHYCHLRAC